MTERFVRVRIMSDDAGRGGKFLGIAWCLKAQQSGEIRLIYTASDRVREELGWRKDDDHYPVNGLRDNEVYSMENATDENTPGKAWAALAVYRLLGEDKQEEQ
jgi:hypothetical protein